MSETFVRPVEKPLDTMAWFTALPETVRNLIIEFPGGRYGIGDGWAYLLGWTDADELMLSMVDPSADQNFANECSFLQRAEHYRRPQRMSRSTAESSDDNLPGPVAMLKAVLERKFGKGCTVEISSSQLAQSNEDAKDE